MCKIIHPVLIILFLALAAMACDSKESEGDKRSPTAMQLIQGKWQFILPETLQTNLELAEKARNQAEVKNELVRWSKEYSLTLTPTALFIQTSDAVREYLIKSASDDGRVLLLIIQPKDAINKTEWINYTFVLDGDNINVDIPGMGIMVFKRVP